VGADRPGDISRIAKWLRPHIVVLTRLPEIPVHIEFFPTLESLIEEKLSLARHVRKDGVLVLNADDERIMSARADLRSRTVTYGFSESADIRGSNVQILAPSDDQAGGVTFKIDFDGNSFPVMLPNIYAESHVSVALAALATSYASGINMVKAIEDIAEYSTPPGRVRLILGKGDTILIDDTYNSSPTAVEAGLSMLSSMPFGKRKIAVLGDMLELGRHTEEAHHAMGVLVKKSADILITVGLRAKQFAEGARSVRMGVKKIFEVDTAEQAAELMEEIMKPGDMIFVKGSQSMRMENFVKHMMAEPERASELLVRQEKEWARK
jgi:UDP-N-acetylmuramyl pentapeptide synthase